MRFPCLKFLILFSILIFVFFSNCNNAVDSGDNVSNTNYVAKESLSFKVAKGSNTKLRVVGITGTIKITGAAQSDTVFIDAVKSVGSESTRDAEEHLPELIVTVEESSNEIFVKTTQPGETYGRNYVVDYTINLPKNMLVTVINVTGTIEVNSIENIVTVNNVTGTITLNQITGNASVVNVTGEIFLDEISGNASVNLTTGNITSKVFLPLNGALTHNLVTGNINLSIPVNTSAQFSATIVTGNINLSNLTLQNQQSSGKTITGTLGGGQGAISLGAVTGNINVVGF
jgi:hypothetical protein